MIKLICVLTGGPVHVITDARGKQWLFEMHRYCGPMVLTGKTHEPKVNQPDERSPFWDAIDLWTKQGSKTTDGIKGKKFCVIDRKKTK